MKNNFFTIALQLIHRTCTRYMKGFLFLFLLIFSLFISFNSFNSASTPHTLRLTSSVSYDGDLISSDNTELTIHIYKGSLESSNIVFTETLSDLTFVDGEVSFEVGKDPHNPLLPSHFNDINNWISFSIEDEEDIVSIESMIKSFFAYEANESPTGNLFPHLTNQAYFSVITNDSNSFSYISTSNLFSLLDIGTASKLSVSDIQTKFDVVDLVVSGNYWDAAFVTMNKITSEDIQNWNAAYSTINQLTTYDITIWNTAGNHYELFPSLSTSSNSIMIISNDESSYDYISTLNYAQMLQLGSAAYLDESSLGDSDDINALLTSSNIWDQAYTSSNLISSTNISEWNNAYLTANLISSSYYSDQWNNGYTTSNLIISSYNATQWNSAYDFYITFNPSTSTPLMMYHDGNYVSITTPNAFGVSSSLDGMIEFDETFSISSSNTTLWNQAYVTANKIQAISNQDGLLLMVDEQQDVFVYISTENWNAGYATSNLITSNRLSQWNQANSTTALFPSILSSSNHYVMTNDQGSEFEYFSSSNIFSKLNLGTVAYVDSNALGTSSNVASLIVSSNYWDAGVLTSNQISSVNISQWTAAYTTFNLFSSFSTYDGHILMVDQNGAFVAISTQNWNLAVATSNLITATLLNQWDSSVTKNALFPNISTSANHLVYSDSTQSQFSYISTQNVYTMMNLGSISKTNISELGSSSDIESLLSSSNYWDLAYVTSNLISADDISSWDGAAATASQITTADIDNWKVAYATSNTIISSDYIHWNLAYTTSNYITSTKVSQWNSAFVTANQLSTEQINQWKSMVSTSDVISSQDISNWNAAYATASAISSIDLTQWDSSYSTASILTQYNLSTWDAAYATASVISSENISEWQDAYDLYATFDTNPSNGVLGYSGTFMTSSTANALELSSADAGLVYLGSIMQTKTDNTDQWNSMTLTANLFPIINSQVDGHIIMLDYTNDTFKYISTANWNAAYATTNQLSSLDLIQWNLAYATSNLIVTPSVTLSDQLLYVNASEDAIHSLTTSNLYSQLLLDSTALSSSTDFATDSTIQNLLTSGNLWDSAMTTMNTISSIDTTQWSEAYTSGNLFHSLNNYPNTVFMIDQNNQLTHVSLSTWNAALATANLIHDNDVTNWDDSASFFELFTPLSSYQDTTVVINSDGTGFDFLTNTELYQLLSLGTAAVISSSNFGVSQNETLLLSSSNAWDMAYATMNLFPSITNKDGYIVVTNEALDGFEYLSPDDWNAMMSTANLITSSYDAEKWNAIAATFNYFSQLSSSETGQTLRFNGSQYVPASSLYILSSGQISIGTDSPSTSDEMYIEGDIYTDDFSTSGNITISGILLAENINAPYDAGNDRTSTYLGSNTGKDNGENNIFIGQFSGTSSTGDNNQFIGNYSGYNSTSGRENSFIGFESGFSNDGHFNTFLGYQSGYSNQSGKFNTFLGHQSGYHESGSQLFYLSNQKDTDLKPTIYGSFSSDQLAIGTSNISSYTLTVDGSGMVSGNAEIMGNLFVSENTSIMGSFETEKTNYLYSQLFVEKNIKLLEDLFVSGNLYVSSNSVFNQDVFAYEEMIFENNNILIGDNTGLSLTTGTSNIFLGSYAGHGETGSNTFYLSYNPTGATDSSPTLYGNLDTKQIAIGTTNVQDFTLTVSGNVYISNDSIISGNIVIENDFTITSSITVSNLIFYDDSSYYLNPEATSNITTINTYSLNRPSHHLGHLVGGESHLGDSTAYTNPIYTVGPEYSPELTALNTMQGIGYGHSSSSFLSSKQNLPSGWGLYVSSSNASLFLGSNTGQIWAEGDLRAPVFYDIDSNFDYYLNPNSTSFLSSLGAGLVAPSLTDFSVYGNMILGDGYSSSRSDTGLTISTDLSDTISYTDYYGNQFNIWGDDQDITSQNRLLSLVNHSGISSSYAALSFMGYPSGGSASSQADIKFLYPDSDLIFSIKDTSDSWKDVMQLSEDSSVLVANSVGIGTSDTSVALNIDASTVLFSGEADSNTIILETDFDNSDECDQPSLQFQQDGQIIQGYIGFFDCEDDFSIYNTYYNENLNLGSGGVTDYMTIDYDGNVTTSGDLFHVEGSIIGYGDLTSGDIIYDSSDTTYYIDPSSTTYLPELELVGRLYWQPYDDLGFIEFDESTSDSGFLEIGTEGDGDEPIIFYQTSTERMRIDSNGDVDIEGSVNVGGTLTVEGTSNYDGGYMLTYDSTGDGSNDTLVNQWLLVQHDTFQSSNHDWTYTNDGSTFIDADAIQLGVQGDYALTSSGGSDAGFTNDYAVYRSIDLPTTFSYSEVFIELSAYIGGTAWVGENILLYADVGFDNDLDLIDFKSWNYSNFKYNYPYSVWSTTDTFSSALNSSVSDDIGTYTTLKGAFPVTTIGDTLKIVVAVESGAGYFSISDLQVFVR